MAEDQLAGKSGYAHELLAELTAEQLAEHIQWLREERARLLAMPPAEPGTSVYASASFAAWKRGNQLSAAMSAIPRPS